MVDEHTQLFRIVKECEKLSLKGLLQLQSHILLLTVSKLAMDHPEYWKESGDKAQ